MATKMLQAAAFWLPQSSVSSIMAEYLAIMLAPVGLWRSNIKALHRVLYNAQALTTSAPASCMGW